MTKTDTAKKPAKLTTEERVTVVAIAAYCWGSGRSLKEAISNCRKSSSHYSKGSEIYGYAFGEGCEFLTVNEMGGIQYRGTAPVALGVVGKISR